MNEKKSEVERILDKIEGEIQTAKKWNDIYTCEMEDRQYYAGKEKALDDLKTWIQENIVDGKTEV